MEVGYGGSWLSWDGGRMYPWDKDLRPVTRTDLAAVQNQISVFRMYLESMLKMQLLPMNEALVQWLDYVWTTAAAAATAGGDASATYLHVMAFVHGDFSRLGLLRLPSRIRPLHDRFVTWSSLSKLLWSARSGAAPGSATTAAAAATFYSDPKGHVIYSVFPASQSMQNQHFSPFFSPRNILSPSEFKILMGAVREAKAAVRGLCLCGSLLCDSDRIQILRDHLHQHTTLVMLCLHDLFLSADLMQQLTQAVRDGFSLSEEQRLTSSSNSSSNLHADLAHFDFRRSVPPQGPGTAAFLKLLQDLVLGRLSSMKSLYFSFSQDWVAASGETVLAPSSSNDTAAAASGSGSIPPDVLEGMAALLLDPIPRARKLQSLALSDCFLGESTVLLPALCRMISHEHLAISHLDISFNQVGEGGADSLAAALKFSSGLRSLFLAGNALGPAGCRRVLEALLASPQLEQLDMSMNRALDVGTLSLAQFLLKHKGLRGIAWNFNEPGIEASALVGDVLARCCNRLTEFSFAGNCGQDRLLQKLCAALEADDCAVQFIDVRFNGMGAPERARDLLEVLDVNESLRHISLEDGNQLPKDMVAKIKAKLRGGGSSSSSGMAASSSRGARAGGRGSGGRSHPVTSVVVTN